MPILLVGGAAVAAVGLLTGFTISGGVKNASEGIKYAALGVAAILIAKQVGWIK